MRFDSSLGKKLSRLNLLQKFFFFHMSSSEFKNKPGWFASCNTTLDFTLANQAGQAKLPTILYDLR